MTTLVNALAKGKRMGTVVRTIKLLKDATVEYFENEKLNLTFCKGTDPETGLVDSVLVRVDPAFTEPRYSALLTSR